MTIPTFPGLRDEAELLRLCARVDRAEDRAHAVEALLPRSLDWAGLADLARDNRVLPLLVTGLGEAGLRAAPEDARLHLREAYEMARIESLRLARAMLRLVSALAEQGIEAVPYKGPALGLTLYADPALRQYVDLDVLVHRADVARASRFLLANGYRSRDAIDAGALEAWIEADCELHFESPDGILVEIHWDVLPAAHRRGFEVADPWGRMVEQRLAGVPVKGFDRADLLLLLCIHGGEKHDWRRLQMIADVARLALLLTEDDWSAAFERARAIGRERTVLLGAALAWAVLHAPLPRRVVERILADPSVVARCALTWGRPFTATHGLPSHAEWRAYLARILGDVERRGFEPSPAPGRARYAIEVLAPDWHDRATLPVSRRLSFLTWLVRPLRLLRKHGAALFRRV
jgi:hypothetical protein